ncbi:hypothetical protein F5884DRAFT_219357 [Xylogone sp. PMI_703]|nr:hypothetical protein F5884DRAFT_219357 [Xylogone sp. PMI_703]
MSARHRRQHDLSNAIVLDDSDTSGEIEVIERPSSSKKSHSQGPHRSFGSKPNLSQRSSMQSSNGVDHPASQSSRRSYGNTNHNDLSVRDEVAEIVMDLDPLEMEDSPSKRSSSKADSQASIDWPAHPGSPLIVRLKSHKFSLGQFENTSSSSQPKLAGLDSVKDPQLTLPERTQENIEKKLQGFLNEMRESHAMTVRWLLHDARRDFKYVKPAWQDKESPFASLQPAQLPQGESAPAGATELKMETLIQKKKTSRIRTRVAAKSVVGETRRVPKYSAYTNVHRNILTGDTEMLKFIPFLGDDAEDVKKDSARKRLLKELDEAYSGRRAGSSRDSERATELRAYMDAWLEQLDIGLDQTKLVHHFLGKGGNDFGLNRRDKKYLLQAHGGQLTQPDSEVARRFVRAFEKVFQFPLKDVILPNEIVKEMVEVGKRRAEAQSAVNEAPVERLGTYTALTCLICQVLSCQTHGDYALQPLGDDLSSDAGELQNQERPREDYKYIQQPLIMGYEDILRKHDVRQANKDPAEVEPQTVKHRPCGDECYLKVDPRDTSYEWPNSDIETLNNILISMTSEKHRACDIAFFMDRPCWQVQAYILKTEPRVLNIGGPWARVRRPDWYDNIRKVLKHDLDEMTTAHLHQEGGQANPCAHAGPCDSRCQCYRDNLLCSNLCGCADDCPRRFTGCGCALTGSACTSESCICFKLNRECGPECASCGAIERIDPANKYNDALFTTGCQNVVLQRGVPKKLLLGESQLEGVGFGAYVGEPVSKGDFLSEYTGEVISFGEAERRGIIYDRKYLSFLFDLNREWVIDAARLGNKTRFINHADNEKDGLNCEAKIMLVNGEHRIKFSALRDIAVGEELLFNYGKKFAEKHGLNKKMPKAKAGDKKGVVVGKEALDVLDGVDVLESGQAMAKRGKMTAIRGGHRGRGRPREKKASKVAVTREVEMEEIELPLELPPDDDSEDEDVVMEDLEDEDDDDLRDWKRKRRTNKPSRYAR